MSFFSLFNLRMSVGFLLYLMIEILSGPVQTPRQVFYAIELYVWTTN